LKIVVVVDPVEVVAPEELEVRLPQPEINNQPARITEAELIIIFELENILIVYI